MVAPPVDADRAGRGSCLLRHGTLDGAPFAGTLTITEFTNDGGVLTAYGVITDADDNFVSNFNAPVESLSVQAAETSGIRAYVPQGQGASCQILFLTLGPLELDVLDLVIEIPEPVIIDIRAEPGPGNLLGNLLCAVANLLNGPGGGIGGALNQIVNLLNQILGAL